MKNEVKEEPQTKPINRFISHYYHWLRHLLWHHKAIPHTRFLHFEWTYIPQNFSSFLLRFMISSSNILPCKHLSHNMYLPAIVDVTSTPHWWCSQGLYPLTKISRPHLFWKNVVRKVDVDTMIFTPGFSEHLLPWAGRFLVDQTIYIKLISISLDVVNLVILFFLWFRKKPCNKISRQKLPDP